MPYLVDVPTTTAYQEVLAPCLSGWREVSPTDKSDAPARFDLHVTVDLGHEFVVKSFDGRVLATVSMPSDRAWVCSDPVLPEKPCRAGDACA